MSKKTDHACGNCPPAVPVYTEYKTFETVQSGLQTVAEIEKPKHLPAVGEFETFEIVENNCVCDCE